MSTIQWVFLLLEIGLAGATFYFYYKGKHTTSVAVANLEAWRTEVELHLDTLIQELEIVLDEALPKVQKSDVAVEATARPDDMERIAASITDTVEIALPNDGIMPSTSEILTDGSATVETHYQEARRLHAQGLDETTIARRTGLEREEVRLLFALTPATFEAQAAPNNGNGSASEKPTEAEATSANGSDTLAPYMSTLLDYLKESDRVLTAEEGKSILSNRRRTPINESELGKPKKTPPQRRRTAKTPASEYTAGEAAGDHEGHIHLATTLPQPKGWTRNGTE